MHFTDENVRARLLALEREARENPGRHKLRLIAIVLMGHAYLLLVISIFPLLIVGLLTPAILGSTRDGGLLVLYIVLAIALVIGFALFALTLLIKIPPPGGQVLRKDEAPELHALIEKVRHATRTPRIYQIIFDPALNAAVTQRRKFGFWGPTRNYLMIGLQLLIAHTPEEVGSVLAHEFAHIRGRHSGFGSWIDRVHRTWQLLAGNLAVKKGIRWWTLGWFALWYRNYFAISTLAQRRIYEYEADSREAEWSGKRTASEALVRLSWTTHRLNQDFWPGIFRLSKEEPLPPSDVFDRMQQFLASDSPREEVCKWVQREMRALTPVTTDHPCLLDRLKSLGGAQFLNESSPATAAMDPAKSAVALLGETRSKLWSRASASWKAMVIHRWRNDHAYAKHVIKQLEAQEVDEKATQADRQWQQLELKASFSSARESIEILQGFLREFPSHAHANYMMGRLLLERNEDGAADYLETAMRHRSSCIPAALSMMLQHYRERGLDENADAVRRRLEEHERATELAKKERSRLTKQDKLQPHDLKPTDLERLRRVLHRYPRVKSAYLARKEVELFADQSSYVLLIQRRWSGLQEDRSADKRLIACIGSEIPFSCAVVIAKWRMWSVKHRIRQVCPAAIFESSD